MSARACILVAVGLAAPSVAAAQPGAPLAPTPPCVPAPAAPTAPATGPDRSGFTVEVGVGLSVFRHEADWGDSATRVGITGLNLTLGGFLSQHLAVGLRVVEDQAYHDHHAHAIGLLGPAVQYWFDDRIFVGAQVGVPYARDYWSASGDGDAIGVGLRAGYSLLVDRHQAVHLSAEMIRGSFGYDTDLHGLQGHGGSLTGVSLQLGWQYL